MPLTVPRDRDGSFEPELVKKGQTRIDGTDDKIIGLYAYGLTVRDIQADAYICPAGKALKQRQKTYKTPPPVVDESDMMRYRARKADCDICPLKTKCCPTQPQRKILRSIYEGARQMARDIAETEEYETSRKLRKKGEMLFAHLKRILGLGRLRLRGPCGAADEFHLAATAQNLRKLAKLLPMPGDLQQT